MLTPNTAELVRIYRYIRANPSEWDQLNWGTKMLCGTAYCFAGHAVHRAGGDLLFDDDELATDEDYNVADDCIMPGGEMRSISSAAAEILGLEGVQSFLLFSGNNTFEDLRRLITEFTGRDPEDALPDIIPGDEICYSDIEPSNAEKAAQLAELRP